MSIATGGFDAGRLAGSPVFRFAFFAFFPVLLLFVTMSILLS
jgi:hypothetical protein